MKKRNERQEEIRNIIRRERVRTQKDLASKLEDSGFICTQATVSRDISEMNIQKLTDGIYVLSEDLHLRRIVSDLVEKVDRVGNLVLIKASVGGASGVAAALDATEFPMVLGSVSGNDTILVVMKNEDEAIEFEKTVSKLKISG